MAALAARELDEGVQHLPVRVARARVIIRAMHEHIALLSHVAPAFLRADLAHDEVHLVFTQDQRPHVLVLSDEPVHDPACPTERDRDGLPQVARGAGHEGFRHFPCGGHRAHYPSSVLRTPSGFTAEQMHCHNISHTQ
jgi:hypothetical protein